MPQTLHPARPWLAAIMAAALLCSAVAHANSFEEDSAKAGFILNFIKYAEWPAAALSGSNLNICTLNDQPLSGKLEFLQGRQVQGRDIRVRVASRASEWRDCQVLFIAANEAQRVDTVLNFSAQQPILTISDAPGFAQAGGIINLKLRGGRMRFDINQGAARQAGLKLSSQLLKLADEVIQ